MGSAQWMSDRSVSAWLQNEVDKTWLVCHAGFHEHHLKPLLLSRKKLKQLEIKTVYKKIYNRDPKSKYYKTMDSHTLSSAAFASPVLCWPPAPPPHSPCFLISVCLGIASKLARMVSLEASSPSVLDKKLSFEISQRKATGALVTGLVGGMVWQDREHRRNSKDGIKIKFWTWKWESRQEVVYV